MPSRTRSRPRTPVRGRGAGRPKSPPRPATCVFTVRIATKTRRPRRSPGRPTSGSAPVVEDVDQGRIATKTSATARKSGRQAPSRGEVAAPTAPRRSVGCSRLTACPLLGHAGSARRRGRRAAPPTRRRPATSIEVRGAAGEARPAEICEVVRRHDPGDRSERVREGRHRRPQPAEDREPDVARASPPPGRRSASNVKPIRSPSAGERQDADREGEADREPGAGASGDVVEDDRGEADEDERRKRRQVRDRELRRDPGRAPAGA